MANRLSILLVEDDPDCGDVMAEALRLDGHEVRQAGTGVEARRSLAASRPDVVVMDACIGDEDGIALARNLRRGLLADVPVLLTTGRPLAEVAAAARAAGIREILIKPIDLDQLTRALARTMIDTPAASEPLASS